MKQYMGRFSVLGEVGLACLGLAGALFCGYRVWDLTASERAWSVVRQAPEMTYRVPMEIDIPAIALHQSIDPGVMQNDTWEISERHVTYLVGSDVIGGTSNLVLYGHRRPGILLDLPRVQEGDEVRLRSAEVTGVYIVKHSYQTRSDAVSEVAPTLAHMVTLYTCDGWHDQYRWVVKAQLVRIESNDSISKAE